MLSSSVYQPLIWLQSVFLVHNGHEMNDSLPWQLHFANWSWPGRSFRVHRSNSALHCDERWRFWCNIGLEEESSGGRRGLKLYEEVTEVLDQFTRYSGWRELSSLNYGDQSNAYSIVSSVEFDKDGEIFAVGGVTKKIKVSSYMYM